MTAALGGGELATEWVTLLPETATLARKLREFKPAPIKVQVEADYNDMEQEGRASGKRTGQHIDTEVDRETRGTGRKAAHNISDGLDDREITNTAQRVGRSIRDNIEGETRKIDFKSVGRGFFTGLGATAGATMQIVRNVGAIATVLKYASRAAKMLSIGMLATSTATRVLSAGLIARFGVALGFAAKAANRLATQVARVTSAVLVLAAVTKLLGFMHKFAKIMSIATIGGAALLGVASALAFTLGNAVYAAVIAVGSALGIAAGAAAGLLGPMLAVGKIGFKGMSEGAKEFNKQFADADETFNKMIGDRMGPMLTAWHSLKNAITDAMSGAMEPSFKNLGTLMDRLGPRTQELSRTFGDLANEVTQGLLGPSATQSMDKMMAASNRFFRSFLGESGLTGATTGLLAFASTAADTFSGTGNKINELLLKFGEFLRGITPAQMKMVFATLQAQLTNIWNIVKPILKGIRDLGAVSAPALAPGFKAIGDAIAQATPGLVNMAKILMPALSQVMANLAPALPALIDAFTPWSQILAVIAPIVAKLVAELAPFAPMILAVATAVKVATIAMALYNTAMLLYTNATRIATAAQWLWNTAFAASGIGTIIVAVVALAAALWAFFTKTEAGRKLWDKIWTGIKNTVTTVWNFIKVEGGKLWESMKPALTDLWNTVKDTFGKVKTAFAELWPKIQPVVAALGKAWLALQKFQWGVIIAALKTLGTVIGWWVSSVVVPGFKLAVAAIQTWWNTTKAIFDVVKTVVMFLWQNVFQPAFTAIAAGWKILWFAIQVAWAAGKVVFDAIKDAVLFVWHNVFEPAFNAIGAVVSAAWSVMGTIFDAIKTAIQAVGDVATWLWHTIFEPVWEGIKAGWDVLWKYLSPIFDVFKSGIQGIGDVASKIAEGIKTAWGGLKQVFLAPLHALGSFLAGVPGSVLGVEIPFVADIQNWGKSLQGLAGGGIIKGPGTGTSDSIVGLDKSGVPTVRVSSGEGIVPKEALSTPIGKLMFAELIRMPGLAGGGTVPGGRGDGLNPGAAWLKDYIMKNYGVSDIGGRRSEDGFGEHSSGNAIDIMVGNDKDLGDRIAGFLKQNKETLGLNGMIWQQRSYGYGGDWGGKFMSDRGSPTQNHMDHIHAILGSGRGASAAAVGLPTGPIVDPSGRSITGGSSTPGTASSYSSTATGSYIVDPKKVREANDRVTDLTNGLDIKQKKLDEYLRKQAAGEKVADTTIEAARDAVDKQSRELEQSKTDLASAEQGTWKEGKSSDKSASGGSDDWSSVGGMIFSGFLESFGFDGSVFKNLFDTPNVKSGMAALNFGMGLLAPQDSAGGTGANGLGGDPSGNILGVGTELLAGVGEQAGVNFPHGDAAAAGATPGPGNGPVFDLRGSQLGVSPAVFEDKMGEMTAASRRHPTLGP